MKLSTLLKQLRKRKATRNEKRQFVVHLNDRDVRIMDYIDTLALKIGIQFPNTITKQEAFKAIYKAFMKRGNPKDARRKAEAIVRNCQIKAIKWWHKKLWFLLVFAWIKIKQYRRKQAFV